MKKSEAKIGVKVRVKGTSIGDASYPEWEGLEGVIKNIGKKDAYYQIGIAFNKPPKVGYFHDLDGACQHGYGRFGHFDEFEVIKKSARKTKKGVGKK